MYSKVSFVLQRYQDEPMIPPNASPQEERSIRASQELGQQNLHKYMALEAYHKAKLAAALDEAYMVII